MPITPIRPSVDFSRDTVLFEPARHEPLLDVDWTPRERAPPLSISSKTSSDAGADVTGLGTRWI
jgi:hypothetical protein